MAVNFFKILGVAPASTAEDTSAAFRNLSRTLHPDAGGDPTAYQHITEAYEVLKDEKRKRDYIRWLELTQTACPNCKGLGIEWRQRGFNGGGAFQICPHCKGGGYFEHLG